MKNLICSFDKMIRGKWVEVHFSIGKPSNNKYNCDKMWQKVNNT